MKKKVLFICTHNSARSQMAEGLVNHFYKERFCAYSAGTQPGEVNPYAIRVMQEIGIDMIGATAKSTEPFLGQDIDLVVTVCDQAREVCPFFPGAGAYAHKGFTDPSLAEGSEEEILTVFRTVRDEIHAWLEEYFQ